MITNPPNMKIKPCDNPAIKKILDEMTIPEGRKNDVLWIFRNLGINESNRNHPQFDWLMTILKFFVLPENL
jgi:hypothetical protein